MSGSTNQDAYPSLHCSSLVVCENAVMGGTMATYDILETSKLTDSLSQSSNVYYYVL
ncbi:UNVERIFIED_CONTAM: hypothetical protein FKN15_029774 [Acipenser sinensis]